ncbi:MAG: hypothetical protein WKG07_29480 [Hymenobacter sp.]
MPADLAKFSRYPRWRWVRPAASASAKPRSPLTCGWGRSMAGHLEAGRKPLSLAATQRLLPCCKPLPAPPRPRRRRIQRPRRPPGPARRRPAGRPPGPVPAPGPPAAPRASGHHPTSWKSPAAGSRPTPCWPRPPTRPPAPGCCAAQEQAAADLDGETAARYHLLRLRAGALEAEAAGLAALLGGAAAG